MNTTICENCNAINIQGSANCHNCKHMLFTERLTSSTTSLQIKSHLSSTVEQILHTDKVIDSNSIDATK